MKCYKMSYKKYYSSLPKNYGVIIACFAFLNNMVAERYLLAFTVFEV